VEKTEDMEMRAVCFTGHRIIGRDLDEEKLDYFLHRLAEIGYGTFICGGALGFDTLVAEKVIRLRKEFPHIRLHMYLPCRNQDSKWSFFDRRRYKRILDSADDVVVMAESYYDGCMRARNYKMVDDADLCMCYLNNDQRSGTAQTVRYAIKKMVSVINVATDGDRILKELKK